MKSASELVKYPRTLHLPWSNWSDDDKVLKSTTCFVGKQVVVTEKMDGENFNGYYNYAHARSLSPLSGADRGFAKEIWANVSWCIPIGYRFCGENLYAKHSIHYLNLKSYLQFFSIWDELNICLSWGETEKLLEELGLCSVPVLYKGIWNESKIREFDNLDGEGYVVRVEESFRFDDFRTCVAKFVRKDHVAPNAKHWRTQQIVPNQLSD